MKMLVCKNKSQNICIHWQIHNKNQNVSKVIRDDLKATLNFAKEFVPQKKNRKQNTVLKRNYNIVYREVFLLLLWGHQI